MKLTNAKVQIALANGRRIYRTNRPRIRYFVEAGLIMKEWTDGKARARMVAAPYTVEDWQAEDWEVMDDAKRD